MRANYQSIPHWSEDDKPREKFILKGRNALSDAELIAILIGTGSSTKTAVDLGRELLQLTNGDLYRFGQLGLSQLCTIKGIGESKAISILAALELGRRRKEVGHAKKKKITSAKSAYLELRPHFEDLQHEEFHLLFLNQANFPIQVRQISIGGVAGTYVDSKVIFKAALDCSATAVILAHNHPSGHLKPSEQDVVLTKKLVKAGDQLEIPILDHLIIADNGYFSFSDNGLM
jgi:DNA repair protein RadC